MTLGLLFIAANTYELWKGFQAHAALLEYGSAARAYEKYSAVYIGRP